MFLAISMRQPRYSLLRIARASRWRTGSAVFLTLAMCTLGRANVSGASRVWTGAANTDFELAANWDVILPPSAPANSTTTDIAVFSGTVTANQPTLTQNRSINGLQFTTASGGWTLGGAFTLSLGNGGISTNGQTSGTNTISANLQLAAAQTWLVGTGGTLVVSGQVSSSGSFGLSVNNGSNAGTLQLNGANTYTGGTTVNAGTLLINNTSGSGTGTGSVTVNNAGTVLGGSGFINAGTNNVAINAGATVAPGAAANSVGALTMTAANVIFTGTSGHFATLAIDISGATADKLAITGSLNLSSIFDRLTVTQLATATLSRYQIVTYTGTLTGIFDTTSLPSGYSLDYSIPNEIDLVAPVPEPATWFAAALVAGAVAWSQRRRFARSFFGNRIALRIVAACSVIISSASATWSAESPQTGDQDYLAIFSPQDGASNNQAVNTFDLERNAITGGNASERSLASQSSGSLTAVNLSKNQNLTITGAPGATVLLSLKSFRMSGTSTFSLQGTATTSFVINVNKQFSLSGSARIILSGGVQWNNVVFNARGKGTVVTLSSRSSLTGILNADERTVKMTDSAIVNGQVNAKKLLLLERSRIVEPPVVSPEQPPAP
jgi:autotransporter-associated beta strand protein